jgi:hypothetical protein
VAIQIKVAMKGKCLKALFNLRPWLTIDETVKRLSFSLKEAVTEAEIFQMALLGRLQISVNFPNYTYAYKGKIFNVEMDESGEPMTHPELRYWNTVIPLPPDHPDANRVVELLKSKPLGFGRFVNIEREHCELHGVFDLIMIGGEQIDILRLYHEYTDGLEIEVEGFDGTWVTDAEGWAYQLLQSFEDDSKKGQFFPAGGLPKNSHLVVRTQAIRDFELSLANEQNPLDKPLFTNERNTLLTIIAALCKKAQIDLNERGVSQRIELCTETLGAPIGNDTILKVLKSIDPGLKANTKT